MALRKFAVEACAKWGLACYPSASAPALSSPFRRAYAAGVFWHRMPRSCGNATCCFPRPLLLEVALAAGLTQGHSIGVVFARKCLL